jgi:hypothetical protein
MSKYTDRIADEQDFLDTLREFKIKVDGYPHNEWVKSSDIWVGIGDTSYGPFLKTAAKAFVRGYVAGVMSERKP